MAACIIQVQRAHPILPCPKSFNKKISSCSKSPWGRVFPCSVIALFDVKERPYRFIIPSMNPPIACPSFGAASGRS